MNLNYTHHNTHFSVEVNVLNSKLGVIWPWELNVNLFLFQVTDRGPNIALMVAVLLFLVFEEKVFNIDNDKMSSEYSVKFIFKEKPSIIFPFVFEFGVLTQFRVTSTSTSSWKLSSTLTLSSKSDQNVSCNERYLYHWSEENSIWCIWRQIETFISNRPCCHQVGMIERMIMMMVMITYDDNWWWVWWWWRRW